MSPTEISSEGHLALKAGDWGRARACFEAALAHHDSPEAHDGLAIALWWLNRVEESHQHRSAAYLGFKKRGAYARAALIAAWLAREQVFLNANVSAMRGWFARAERLLARVGSCAEEGWFAILRASMLAVPEELAQAALHAEELASKFEDGDLEAVALAYAGMAQVSLGHVERGMAQLDEAMTAALGGEVGDYMAVSEVFCVMLSACELAGDLERTEHWCQAAADFARRRSCEFLAAYCQTTYGGLLIATGRWHAAENALSQAMHSFDSGHRALRVHAVLKLADLRVHQGRLEEAEALLAGYEDYGTAVLPLAKLHIGRGQLQLAQALLAQSLGPGELQADTLDNAPKLLLLIDVLIRMGDLHLAESVTERLGRLAERAGSDLLRAQAEFARGQVQRQAGDIGAVSHFQAALQRLRSYDQSLLASRVRLEMARLLMDSDRPGAVTWARAALACFERLGADRDASEAVSFLRNLGVVVQPGPKQQERMLKQLTQRELEVLSLLAAGLTNREIAERLYTSVKTIEHHVSQILGKLDVRSRTEAVALWVKIAVARPTERSIESKT